MEVMGFESITYIHGFIQFILRSRTYYRRFTIINQSLRENDKVKEDALAHLSDQLLVERIQQLERKQVM